MLKKVQEIVCLKEHIIKILDKIMSALSDCEEKTPFVLADIRKRMKGRISNLLDRGQEIENGRLEQELAFYAERHDISEEVERLKSHNSQARSLLSLEGPVGVKLGFIFQEMAREAGTLYQRPATALLHSVRLTCGRGLRKPGNRLKT
jgi:uncharacterized protein (TIGR00255 family)